MRRIAGAVLLTAVTVLAVSGTASATPLSYTFDSNNQGWQQNQDQASNSFFPAGFKATDGNPGGHLSAVDTGGESGCPGKSPCQLLTFYSPKVAPLGANYGGIGSFDLRSKDVNPVFGAELLLLPSGSEYLDGLIPETIAMTFIHLSIPLNETANWAVCLYGGGSCHPPSQGEFRNLIAASDQVAVMADVGPNRTGETYDLDNVVLTDGTPQPPPPHTKKKCKKKGKKNRGHRASAAKKCKKKRRVKG